MSKTVPTSGALRPERAMLAPGLEISRIVTGLWQVADMERSGTLLDPHTGAAAMKAYASAGFDTFDMADHYGSSEVITGTLLKSPDGAGVRAFTKWCPPPGPMTAEVVRTGVQRALDRMQTDCIDLMQFHGGPLKTRATSTPCKSWPSCAKKGSLPTSAWPTLTPRTCGCC